MLKDEHIAVNQKYVHGRVPVFEGTPDVCEICEPDRMLDASVEKDTKSPLLASCTLEMDTTDSGAYDEGDVIDPFVVVLSIDKLSGLETGREYDVDGSGVTLYVCGIFEDIEDNEGAAAPG